MSTAQNTERTNSLFIDNMTMNAFIIIRIRKRKFGKRRATRLMGLFLKYNCLRCKVNVAYNQTLQWEAVKL